jgi:uncharacterized glyoxalase superfamily protein PhnB
MITGVGLLCVWVTDQDEAYDFYVNKLGCKVSTDVEMDGFRYLLVTGPEQPDVHIMLTKPEPPIMSEETAESIRTLMATGHLGPGGFATSDCRATYQDLKAKGVEFIDEPEERFYGIDAGFRDPFGNHWRLTQVKPNP